MLFQAICFRRSDDAGYGGRHSKSIAPPPGTGLEATAGRFVLLHGRPGSVQPRSSHAGIKPIDVTDRAKLALHLGPSTELGRTGAGRTGSSGRCIASPTGA